MFNLLTVHELGHFLAAKWRGLKIERFAIWFGPAIWKGNGGSEYSLNSIPFGGVGAAANATMEGIEGKNETVAESPAERVAARQDHRCGLRRVVQLYWRLSFCPYVWGVGCSRATRSAPTVIGWW